MRPPFSRAVFVAVLLAAGAVGLARPAHALPVIVPLNHATRVNLRGVAASVVVGNPSIASVTVVDTHTVYIMGRGPGSTNVAILDRSGRTLFTDDVTVTASGAHLSLFRGEKRVQVSCSYGCEELNDAQPQPNTSLGVAPSNAGRAPMSVGSGAGVP
jgi:Flp pilus assembly secretin CpaC